MEQALNVKWIDGGREPQCAPNPNYPNGIDLDMSKGAAKTCTANLRYPALRIGHHIVTCPVCKQRVSVTTAGRVDDPKTVKLACMATVN